jgi:hypothetical protein
MVGSGRKQRCVLFAGGFHRGMLPYQQFNLTAKCKKGRHFNQGIENTRVTLGGKPLSGPVATTCYFWMPLDPTGLLSKGKNTLEVRGTFFNATLPEPATLFPKLAIAVPQSPKILHGPVLGSLDAEFFSVTCKTGVPAKVTVRATDAARPDSATSASSGGGYYHRLKIPLPKGARKVSYRVTAELGGKKSKVGPFSFHLPRGPAGHLKFVVIGNTRCHHLYTKHTGPKLAAAMLAQKPDLFLHAGQVSEFPWWDFYWEPAFFEPYRKLVRTVPTYLVGPEFREHSGGAKAIFYTPASEGYARTWTQVIQGVRIIAIDGIQDWSAASNNTKWLDTVLSESKEKYVFVFDHFPGYASGKLSRPPLFRPMAQAREVIHPLLAKHKATALISACEFEYERSEPEGDKGVPQIVIGGGGAKYYAQSGRATRNNPFIKVYHRRHGFCLFEVQGEKCLMRAIDIDGVEMDRRSFAPR